MDKGLRRQSFILGIPGVILQLAGSIMLSARGPRADRAYELSVNPGIAGVCLMAGLILLLSGLALYSQARGHSRWLCLLGFLSIFGFAAVAMLGDNSMDAQNGTVAARLPHPLARLNIFIAILGLFPGVGIVFGALAVVLGLTAYSRCKRDPALSGRVAAIIGTILGALCVLRWGVPLAVSGLHP